jgi:hypothetical protein
MARSSHLVDLGAGCPVADRRVMKIDILFEAPTVVATLSGRLRVSAPVSRPPLLHRVRHQEDP